MESRFYALLQVDAYNETIFNVCLDTPEAKTGVSAGNREQCFI